MSPSCPHPPALPCSSYAPFCKLKPLQMSFFPPRLFSSHASFCEAPSPKCKRSSTLPKIQLCVPKSAGGVGIKRVSSADRHCCVKQTVYMEPSKPSALRHHVHVSPPLLTLGEGIAPPLPCRDDVVEDRWWPHAAKQEGDQNTSSIQKVSMQ